MLAVKVAAWPTGNGIYAPVGTHCIAEITSFTEGTNLTFTKS